MIIYQNISLKSCLFFSFLTVSRTLIQFIQHQSKTIFYCFCSLSWFWAWHAASAVLLLWADVVFKNETGRLPAKRVIKKSFCVEWMHCIWLTNKQQKSKQTHTAPLFETTHLHSFFSKVMLCDAHLHTKWVIICQPMSGRSPTPSRAH